MERNTIIAIILTLVVWLAWSYFFTPPKPVPQQAQKIEQKNSAEKTENGSAAQQKVTAVVEAAAEKTVKKVNITTKFYDVTLTNSGAKIESMIYGPRKVELVTKSEKHKAGDSLDYPLFFSEKEFLSKGVMDDSLWTVQSSTDSEVIFAINAAIGGSNVVIQKTFKFYPDKFYFDLTYKISNSTANNVIFPGGCLIISTPDFLGPDMKDYSIYSNELYQVYKLDDSMEKGSKGGGWFSKETETKIEKGNISWVGILSRYFVTALIPDSKSGKIIYDSRGNTGFRTGFYYEENGLAANSVIEKKFKVAMSEKIKDKLITIDPSLVDATDSSKWIEPIKFVVVWCLEKLFAFIPNFGWAIIIFSIITKIVFLPLTIKSTNSMKKMGQLAPEIKKLQEKYKDKPELIQKETMKLYKEKGVNPLGGCLPVLVQMPFFIALYSALSNSLDMWQRPFTLWMTDLSMPDTVFTYSGFNLNILPIVMTATSFIMQKMSSADVSSSPQQKMMMNLMPIMLIFIFWNMPSGLILYWIMQNVLQIGHQYYAMKFSKNK